MKIDKDTILKLIEQYGARDRVGDARTELPDQVDTDDQGHRGLLSKFGLDAGQLGGLLDKLPAGLGDKLGKLL